MATIILLMVTMFVYQSKGGVAVDGEYTAFAASCNRDAGKYTNGSLYEQNLNDLIINLYKQSSITNFYNNSFGTLANDTVYGLYQCRVDLTLHMCSECVREASRTIFARCPFSREGIVWYYECMLRYANRSFFSLAETDPDVYDLAKGKKSSDYPNFDSVFKDLMNRVVYSTTLGSSKSGYSAYSSSNLTLSQLLYGFAQCTHDIDGFGCNTCLSAALTQITTCCNSSVEAEVFYPSCQLRYDLNPVLNKTKNTVSAHSPSDVGKTNPILPHNKSKMNLPIILGLAIGGSICLALLCGGIWWCRRNNVSKRALKVPVDALIGLHTGDADDIRRLESMQFDFNTIKIATCNFSEDNKLGQGGFGIVYKGTFANGQDIAVKRLSKNSQQGTLEFKNEVLLVAKLQHKNLVKLLGFCVDGKEQILVYEFLPNLSLDRFLDDHIVTTLEDMTTDKVIRASLDWDLRFKIISGVARGLLYLHEDSRLKIIHRDLKSSNILLDEAMTAKIADFGLAKLFSVDQTEGDTGRIAGTFGYMAPEYALAGLFSVKSDVYSFGVIVLELVSGRKNSFFHRHTNEESLLNSAWRFWNEEAPMELVDSSLGENFSVEKVKLCIHIGLLCIQEDAVQRPRMAYVVAALSGHSVSLPSPNAPHFFKIGSVRTTDASCSNYDSLPENENYSGSQAGMTNITEMCPR